MFSGSPLFILTLTCLTKDAENVSKMLKARLEKVPAAPNRKDIQFVQNEYNDNLKPNLVLWDNSLQSMYDYIFF